MTKLNWLDWTASVLVIVGAINWGLIGFFEFDLVASFFGSATTASRAIYDIVGISGLWLIYTLTKLTKITGQVTVEKPSEMKRAA
jgi:hypothetical protein